MEEVTQHVLQWPTALSHLVIIPSELYVLKLIFGPRQQYRRLSFLDVPALPAIPLSLSDD